MGSVDDRRRCTHPRPLQRGFSGEDRLFDDLQLMRGEMLNYREDRGLQQRESSGDERDGGSAARIERGSQGSERVGDGNNVIGQEGNIGSIGHGNGWLS